ncbi:MAG: hypothetical protein EA378_07610 [Phycisphaerales bacterium]|nr:MAG: hypothetical protein EA378_07610 [Phycisphaerales bacterium]
MRRCVSHPVAWACALLGASGAIAGPFALDLAGAAEPVPVASPPRFGEPDGRWWSLGVTYAPDLTDATDVNAYASVSRFLVQDFEVMGELAIWYFAQPGRDAAGVNPALNLRWHIVNTHRDPSAGAQWSLFIDAGMGVLASTGNVPSGGTGLNFTPRAGAGLTWRPSAGRSLYHAGVRWHHISNARIHGNERNPDRDAPAFYAGVGFPF